MMEAYLPGVTLIWTMSESSGLTTIPKAHPSPAFNPSLLFLIDLFLIQLYRRGVALAGLTAVCHTCGVPGLETLPLHLHCSPACLPQDGVHEV